MVKTFAGHSVVRRVWAVGKGLVYLMCDEEFDKLIAGHPAVEAIGFPVEDVLESGPLLARSTRARKRPAKG